FTIVVSSGTLSNGCGATPATATCAWATPAPITNAIGTSSFFIVILQLLCSLGCADAAIASSDANARQQPHRESEAVLANEHVGADHVDVGRRRKQTQRRQHGCREIDPHELSALERRQ